ncbi:MAG: PAS domain-containing protein [Verrucomicrobiaceae bacterium]|nr:PAS domain-containing protein [Verrucomicrobiaceae bacterium]
MALKPHTASPPGELRLAAEKRLTLRPADVTSMPELLRLQHELQVHQIELELQNEQLQAAQVEIQKGLECYTDMFDFAPVGYLNLTKDGTVNLVNLFGAQLLGLERDELLERRLGLFIPKDERSAFSQFLLQVFASNTRQTCELNLLVQGASTRIVKVIAVRSDSSLECRVVLLDITERKRAEQTVREQLNELLRWHHLMLAREGRVQEMKAEVNELLAQQGSPARYPSQVKS